MKRWGHRFTDRGSDTVLDTWFPRSNEQQRRGALAEKLGLIKSDFVEVELGSLDDAAKSIEEVYLRLHLLSDRG